MLSALRSQLASHGQEHLAAFWDRLDAAARDRLVAQLGAIDWEEFAGLRKTHQSPADSQGSSASPWQELAARAKPPHAIPLGSEPVGFTRKEAKLAGEEACGQARSA